MSQAKLSVDYRAAVWAIDHLPICTPDDEVNRRGRERDAMAERALELKAHSLPGVVAKMKMFEEVIADYLANNGLAEHAFGSLCHDLRRLVGDSDDDPKPV